MAERKPDCKFEVGRKTARFLVPTAGVNIDRKGQPLQASKVVRELVRIED